MDNFQIETAQNVSITQQAANISDRLLAYFIDSFVIITYSILAFLLLAAMGISMSDTWSLYLLISLPAFLYYLLFETLTNGKTIGKYLVNIRVVRLDGSSPSFSNYFVRWVLRIIDVTLSSGGLAVLTILFKGNGQRIGDIAAGTTVISEKKKISVNNILLVQLPDGYQPKYPQVTILKDSEIQMIKNVFMDAKRKGQHHLVLKLHDRIAKVLEVTPDEKPIDFVDTIIKDYSFYTQDI